MTRTTRTTWRGWLAAAIGVCLLLSACDETDLTSIRITVNPDGTGEIRASTVGVPDTPARVEDRTGGVTWSERVALHAASGRFDDVRALTIADIGFEYEVSERGTGQLVVTLPRGPDAEWPVTIAPADEDRRRRAAAAFDETGRLEALGAKIRVVVEVPGDIAGSGALPARARVDTKHDKREATLTVPVEYALGPGDPIEWHITWAQGK
ncbi:MAG: hypothetical protein ACYTG1_08150 [Planctomycetota bacterium]|jgi:hypothetical protein